MTSSLLSGYPVAVATAHGRSPEPHPPRRIPDIGNQVLTISTELIQDQATPGRKVTSVLPSQRRHAILAAVRAEDAASAEALARQFDVSVETIRRDLRALHSDGLLERVYGGATRPSGRSTEGSFSARSVQIGRAHV